MISEFKVRRCAILVLVAAAAYSANDVPQPAIGTYGLDLTAGNEQVRPGDDFFAYANGNWYDSFEIPPDHARFDVFVKLDEQSKERVRAIIEQASTSTSAPGSSEQKIGDYYAAFMDEAKIDALGLDAARPYLDRIMAATSKKDIATLFALPNCPSVFSISIPADLKRPDRYTIAIGTARLGLPDREYYLKDDPKLAGIREQYLAYIEQMLTLGKIDSAAEVAKKVLAFETGIAEVQWPIEQRRDVQANHNPRTKAELLDYAPGFDWQAFFDTAGVGTREDFVIRDLTAVRDVARLMDGVALEDLQMYLAFRYLSDNAEYLPKPFDEARFDFYERTLRGQPQERERWKRGVEEVDYALGELVGQVYVAKYFPQDSKAKMEDLVGNLRVAFGQRIEALTWMTSETKKRAQQKLALVVTKVGYPEKWKDYSGLEVRRSDLLGNIHRVMRWRWEYQVARLDKPVDRQEWYMNPQTVNAYYNPAYNEIVFPAAFLQPPFFDPNADPAVNYGAIGAAIGHELGHGFDDQGRKFAGDGSLTDWWTAEDSEAFTERANNLNKQYSAFEALPGLNVNGALTLGENIGDLGGLSMAYYAYKLSLNGVDPPVLDGYTGDQRFFLSWAQVWRAKIREEALRQYVMTNPHSPPIARVNGTVSNMDAWYAAFDVQPADKLYLEPEERIAIW